MVGNLSAVVVAAALAAGIGPIGAASAAPADGTTTSAVVLGTTTGNTPISAYRDWVVWSAHSAEGWQLVASHAGTVATLPVGPRPEPFDVDLGTDSRNRLVATYSRCIRTPTANEFGKLQPWTGAGCRAKVLLLASGREDDIGIGRPIGVSDTTPSMWRGDVAFARRDPKHHKDVMQVRMWSHRTGRTTALRHGGVPTSCGYQGGCRNALVRGAVQGLDLGSRLVTFLWSIEAPGVGGHIGWEVRANRLSDGRSVLAGAGFAGEVCGEGEIDTALPSAPIADSGAVWYSLRKSICYRNSYSAIRFNTRTAEGRAGKLSREPQSLVKSGSAYYGLLAPAPDEQVQPHCDLPGHPCSVERLPRPILTTKLRRPLPPYS